MKNVEVGQKVVAFWGAMIPEEYCVVAEVYPHYAVIVNEEGEKFNIDNVLEMPMKEFGKYMKCCRILHQPILA